MKMKIALIVVSIAITLNVVAQDEFTRAREGQDAPGFSYTTLQGDKHTLSDLDGKVVWITFFATWCGPCRKELPNLEKEVYEKYKDHPDFRLLVVGREHSREELEKFIKDTGHNLPFIPDPKREIFDKYAAQNIPRNFIIDKTGKIAVSSVGFNENDFNDKLTKLKELLR